MSEKPGHPDHDAMLQRIRAFEESFSWICIDAVASPTADQIKALQTFYPKENLLEIRRRLANGEARIGPIPPDAVDDFAAVALRGTNLSWHAKSGAEIDRA
jgi:hypothetical protein